MKSGSTNAPRRHGERSNKVEYEKSMPVRVTLTVWAKLIRFAGRAKPKQVVEIDVVVSG